LVGPAVLDVVVADVVVADDVVDDDVVDDGFVDVDEQPMATTATSVRTAIDRERMGGA
jgi:hypothetical protein